MYNDSMKNKCVQIGKSHTWMNFLKTTVCLLSAAFIWMMIPVAAVAAVAAGVNVDVHTQEEIRSFISENGNLYRPVEYVKNPDMTSGKTSYDMGDQGEISENTRLRALAMLKNIRYVAGLSTDITLDDTLNSQAQAGAYVDYVNGTLTHYPQKVAGMSDELFDLGYTGTTSSNIAKGQANLTAAMLDWMSDEDASNVDSVGHRRWQLNPKLTKIGLGAVGAYYVHCCHDRSGSGSQTGVVWPAQNMPVDYFESDYPWSISMGQTVSNAKVTLTRTRDNRVWSFENQSQSFSNSGYVFTINNDGYGQTGCIIFRPDDIVYHSGDRFHVEVSGSVTADYYVEFFSLNKATTFEIPDKANIPVNGTKKLQMTILPENASEKNPIWTSSDENVCTVDDSGTITAKGNIGASATITAILDGITKTCQVTIGKSLEGATVAFTDNLSAVHFYWDNAFCYTGREVRPSAVVSLNGKTLTEGVDYKLYYENNTAANMSEQSPSSWMIHGYSRMIVSGENEYGGDLYKQFNICETLISDKHITVNIRDAVYKGGEIRPEIELKYSGEDPDSSEDDWTLTEGIDYEITSCENNTNVTDQAKVTITGLNGFYGTRTGTFKILPLGIDDAVVSDIPEQEYSFKAITPEPAVSINGITLKKDTDYTLSYENNEDAGTASIIIDGKGNFTGKITKQFTITPRKLSSCTAEPIAPVTFTGNMIEPVVSLKDQTGYTLVLNKDYTVAYSENLNAGEEGAASAKATGIQNYAGTLNLTFTIKPAELTEIKGIVDKTYTGSEQSQGTMEVWSGSSLMAAMDSDYTVTYENNVNAGTALVKVHGTGNFSGDLERSFTISPADLKECGKIIVPKKVYDRNMQEAEITVTGIGGTTLDESTYTVTGETGGTNAGTYSFIVSAKEGTNYTGSLEGIFEIQKASIDAYSVSAESQTFTGAEIVPEVAVKNEQNTLSVETDYDFIVTDGSNESVSPLNVGTYNITAAGKGNYTGTASGTFTVNCASLAQAAISLSDPEAEYVYTGNEIFPGVQVKLGDIVLPAENNYEVIYSNNVNANAGTDASSVITVSASVNGNLTGSPVSLTFKIKPADISATAEITLNTSALVYDGTEQKPQVASVKIGENALEVSDFEVTYPDTGSEAYRNQGTYTVCISGKGNYTGSKDAAFTITPASLQGAAVTLNLPEDGYTYNGNAFEPAISAVVTENSLHPGSDDYTVEYSGNINAGTAAVELSGIGNYTGSVKAEFVINPADLNSSGITAAAENQTYTGRPVTTTVHAMSGDKELAEGTEYLVSYQGSDYTNAGEVSVKVTGIGNYTGEISSGFRINQADISAAKVTVPEGEQIYTGAELRPVVTVTLNGLTLPETDYTVTYSGNVEIGTATVTVYPSGNGNLTGVSAAGTFAIKEKSAELEGGGNGGNAGGGGNGGDGNESGGSGSGGSGESGTNGAGGSDGQGASAGRTAAQPTITIPKTVRKLKASVKGRKVTITWKKDKKTIRKHKIQGYELRISQEKDPEKAVIRKQLGKNKTKHKVKLKRGTWYVWIRYFRGDGVSNWKMKKVKVKK